MELKLKPLRYFLAVAREKSFSKAAARLFVSQPALSAQIKSLEQVLGFDLFARSSRHVELTRQGRLFQVEAQQMMSESERLRRAVQVIKSIDLRLGASFYSLLIAERAELIDRFIVAHPEVALAVNNRNQFRLFEELEKGQIDLALAMGLQTPAAERGSGGRPRYAENVLPEGFERLTLCRRRVRLLVPDTSALAAVATIPSVALRNMRIAVLGRHHGAELVDAITGFLDLAGVERVEPPESNAVAVERYGAQFGIPAISTGWFPPIHSPTAHRLVARPVESLDVTTELALLRVTGTAFEAANTFWAFAAGLAPAWTDGGDAPAVTGRRDGVSA